jgi:N-methylhydantoinase B
MRFSANGYYIERYVKCDCCGVLIYGEGLPVTHPTAGSLLYCSAWCKAWHAQKLAGVVCPDVPTRFD